MKRGSNLHNGRVNERVFPDPYRQADEPHSQLCVHVYVECVHVNLTVSA